MKKTTLLITILFSIMTLAGTAMAAGPCPGKANWNQNRGQNCQGYGPMASNLTPEQQTQLSELRQTFFDQTSDQRIALVAKEKEFQILMETSSPDKTQLMQLTSEISELKVQLAEKYIDFVLEAKTIDPDFRGGMMNRGGRWHRGGSNKGPGCQGQNLGCQNNGPGCIYN